MTADTSTVSPALPAVDSPPDPYRSLTNWLAGLARTGNRGAIVDLQRPHHASEALARAGRFAPDDSIASRTPFEVTAYLFAAYHAGLPWADNVRLYGSGDLGTAMRRIGSGALRGPRDPGCDRLFKQIVAPGPLPRVRLEHAIKRLRNDDRFPPSWSQLAHDLAAWNDSEAAVRHQWARSFWAPRYHVQPKRTHA
ncbi:type I-E CRISPR-associated protein Cse2/CasB [Streptomyces noursei]|uniref:type I-E CRISPR-associated protein Cse2/CasB n=1 Tax=Streptomyces noursei TaxID=1971 RepID=UPI0023B86736|nr:type I-E CRISPR-associated protein Cse2/CasB [Streptomyces noursei]